MNYNKTNIIFISLFLIVISLNAKNNDAPYGLTVNMLTKTDQVLVNGYSSNTMLHKTADLKESFQTVEVSTNKPFFGWILPYTEDKNIQQESYQLLIATTRDALIKDSVDIWNSGKIKDNRSANIIYEGKLLEPNEVYFWKVKIWDNQGNASNFSEISAFKTSDKLTKHATDRLSIQKKDEFPIKTNQIDEKTHFADFGKAAFGRVRLSLYSDKSNDTVILHLGESKVENRVNRKPGGSIRYSNYQIALNEGWNSYIVTITPDKRNTGPQAILIPEYIGEVTPFRYLEIENYNHQLDKKSIIRETAFYPFNDKDSYFHSSDTILNQVWELSKYSIKATSFLGVYIDGDRERIPYEADAIINQLSHYCVSRDAYNMARYSHEYLINNPTWPTEWILQSVLMAWEDYKYSGNTSSLEHYYNDLKAKTLISLTGEDGFISTRTGKVTPEILESIHFKGKLRDIVDWPHPNSFGMEEEKGGETDGFVFTDINTVVNSYHYRNLTLMADIANLLNYESDRKYFLNRATKLKKSFNSKLFDNKRGVYIDGIGTDHASLHANMFPLAFGLVEEKNIESVIKFIRSRGMACSVYGSQFLMDAIYYAGDGEYGLQLLTSTGDRSWYNMIRSGSTITMEAWDNKFKPNQDWNHAWGAAPANIIPRKLMGIEPIDQGFKKFRIKPQPGSLEFADIKHPTLLGDIKVSFNNNLNEYFQLEVSIPVNTTADVYLPYYSRKQTLLLNGQPVKYRKEGNFSVIDEVGSGKWSFSVKK